MNVTVSFDINLNPGVPLEWFAEQLFDVLCDRMDDFVPDAVQSVDSYDFRVQQ